MLRTKFKCRNFHAFLGFIQPCGVERSEFRFVSFTVPQNTNPKNGKLSPGVPGSVKV